MSRFSIASSSASSTITNCPFETSQPRTSSSDSTSRSCTGHQRFCLIGVPHSRWSIRNDTSDWRAEAFVAGARPTGMLTRPKLTEPFQEVRMQGNCTGTLRLRRVLRGSCSDASPAATFAPSGSRTDDREPVAGRGRGRAPGSCLPARGRRGVAGGIAGRGGDDRRRARERPARPRRREGRLVRAARPNEPRVGALRLRARARRRRRGSDLLVELVPGRSLRARALAGGGRARRGRRAAREDRRVRGTGPDVRRPPAPAGARPSPTPRRIPVRSTPAPTRSTTTTSSPTSTRPARPARRRRA